jgi:hypothetical protein
VGVCITTTSSPSHISYFPYLHCPFHDKFHQQLHKQHPQTRNVTRHHATSHTVTKPFNPVLGSVGCPPLHKTPQAWTNPEEGQPFLNERIKETQKPAMRW